jgi:hypothetical protein
LVADALGIRGVETIGKMWFGPRPVRHDVLVVHVEPDTLGLHGFRELALGAGDGIDIDDDPIN